VYEVKRSEEGEGSEEKRRREVKRSEEGVGGEEEREEESEEGREEKRRWYRQ
jgi:hypothetical protein